MLWFGTGFGSKPDFSKNISGSDRKKVNQKKETDPIENGTLVQPGRSAATTLNIKTLISSF